MQSPRTHHWLVLAACLSTTACGPPPTPGPKNMGINVPERCYHATANGRSLHFVLTSLTTPTQTDGMVEVIISDPANGFAPIRQNEPARLGKSPAINLEFDVEIPPDATASGPVDLVLHAVAYDITYTATVKRQCP